MKSFSYLFMAGLMTLGFWACSDEANLPTEEGKESQIDKVYMSFNLELPTASRSATDDTGTTNSDATPESEVGTDVENKVSTIQVVLATQSGTAPYYTYQYVTGTDNLTPSVDASNYTVTFQSKDLESVAGAKVAVFVFCNMGPITKEIFNASTPAVINSINSITGDDQFWMSNAKIVTCNLPTFNELKVHNTESNPVELGEVEVERSVARFDFKGKAVESSLPINSYVLEGDAANPTLYVTLEDMALINMSNNFKYLRTVADNNSGEFDDRKIVICGEETFNMVDTKKVFNFVLDSDADDKTDYDYLPGNFLNYWNLGSLTLNDTENNFGDTGIPVTTAMNFGEVWTSLVASGEAKSLNTLSTTGYQAWRYSTENTQPSIAKQIKSLSTGVLFRGKLVDVSGTLGLNGTNNVYVHNNVLYGTWTQVMDKVALIDNTVTDAKLVALKAAATAASTADSDETYEPTLEEASAQGFTVYKPEGGNYYAYYYYVNRHNDNNNPEVMEAMEFAVVRNNVYKLSVSNIFQYGHPGDPLGDPDPLYPSTPDEEKNVYFKVTVQVLPWVVRTNNIEF